MFDIGFSEIVLLMVVGLVVLGPKRLPIAIRTVMSWVKTVRGLAANVQNELKQELKLQELQDSIKKAEALNLKSLSPELSQTVEELKAQADKMKAELEAKAAAAGTTVEEQIREMKSAVEKNDVSSEAVTDATAGEQLQISSAQTDKQEIASSDSASQESPPEASPEVSVPDFSELDPHEQAELTERLSDYYTPDDDVPVAPKPQEKS